MNYRSEIDGLRAVAVIPVILFHAGFSTFRGGFVGVDIFFVISGFLITTIILSDIEREQFSIITFYERRARRILPALFFVILCCLPFAWLWLLPVHLKDFSESIAAVSLFSSNILFWKESGYFATEAELKPLLHTWSLAVEEQYYILFPLFLVFACKYFKKRILLSLSIVTFVSFVIAQFGSVKDPVANFFLLPSRGWELAIGAFVAFLFLYKQDSIVYLRKKEKNCEIFSSFGMLLILVSILFFKKSTPFPSFYTFLPTVGTALVIIYATPTTIVGRFLSTKFMVQIGLISYSAYLWHQPIICFLRHRSLTDPDKFIMLFVSVLSLFLGYLSWRYVEIPFRDKKVISRKSIFIFASIGSLIFLTVGLYGHYANGFDGRKNKNGVYLAELDKKIRPNYGLHKDCVDKFTLSPECRTSNEPEILVWGDSYAMHLVDGILSSKADAKIIQMTKSSCGPFFDLAPVIKNLGDQFSSDCLDFNKSVYEWLKNNNSIKYAVISSPFSQYLGKNKLLYNGKIIDESNNFVAVRFLDTLEKIKNMGITPVVFSPLPTNNKDLGMCLVKSEQYGVDFVKCGFDMKDIHKNNKEAFEFLRSIENKQKIIFLDKFICKDEFCRAAIDNVFIFRDIGHFSYSGSSFVGKEMNFYNLITIQ